MQVDGCQGQGLSLCSPSPHLSLKDVYLKQSDVPEAGEMAQCLRAAVDLAEELSLVPEYT